MARLKSLKIEGYRSINEEAYVKFPPNQPVVLIGENNAGKTNITRAIELLFGEFHPKYKDLEDHEHYERNPKRLISIEAEVSDFNERLGRSGEFSCSGFRYEAKRGEETKFVAIQEEDGEENIYVSNKLRNELTSIVVNAEQNLSYQLSYTSKYTLLSKVMRTFHEKLTGDEERVEKLKGLYEEIKTTFLEVPEFKKFRDSMSKIADTIISNMTYGLELDFSAYDPSNYFRSLRVNPVEESEARSFDELGTGQQQLLALSFAHAYSKSFLKGDLILIIDEPESHLHPLAQKWLAKTMFKMAEEGLQLIITTHSPHFINLEYLEGINLVYKMENGTVINNKNAKKLYEHCLSKNANSEKTTEDTIIPFYANQATPHILNGFFAKKIILVEGLTEELAIPIFFEKLGFNTSEYGIETIAVMGKGNLSKWWRFFTLYEIPVYVCFDNDSSSDESGNRRKDTLKTIGIEENNIEEVLGYKKWNINEKFCVFGKDYEDTMRVTFEEYENIENEKKEKLGSASKHIIAREVAKEIKLEGEEGTVYFQEMIDYIKALE